MSHVFEFSEYRTRVIIGVGNKKCTQSKALDWIRTLEPLKKTYCFYNGLFQQYLIKVSTNLYALIHQRDLVTQSYVFEGFNFICQLFSTTYFEIILKLLSN